MTYADFIFALTLWREASSTTHAARYGIGCVIWNRVRKGGWWAKPNNDVVSVCLHPGQFSSMTIKGNADLIRWPMSNDVVFSDCLGIAATSEAGLDVTSGALFYWTFPLVEAPEKEWGPTSESVLIDGVHFCVPLVTP